MVFAVNPGPDGSYNSFAAFKANALTIVTAFAIPQPSEALPGTSHLPIIVNNDPYYKTQIHTIILGRSNRPL